MVGRLSDRFRFEQEASGDDELGLDERAHFTEVERAGVIPVGEPGTGEACGATMRRVPATEELKPTGTVVAANWRSQPSLWAGGWGWDSEEVLQTPVYSYDLTPPPDEG